MDIIKDLKNTRFYSNKEDDSGYSLPNMIINDVIQWLIDNIEHKDDKNHPGERRPAVIIIDTHEMIYYWYDKTKHSDVVKGDTSPAMITHDVIQWCINNRYYKNSPGERMPAVIIVYKHKIICYWYTKDDSDVNENERNLPNVLIRETGVGPRTHLKTEPVEIPTFQTEYYEIKWHSGIQEVLVRQNELDESERVLQAV